MSNKKEHKKVRNLSWTELLQLAKNSIREFIQEDSLMHGAALAYYAVFALIPIIYLAISFFGYIVGQDRVIMIVGDLLENNMGMVDVSSITELMYRTGIGSGGSALFRAIGIFTLVFTSTAMFNSLGKSINAFYGIKKENRKRGFLNQLLSRLISIGVMAALATIVIVLYFTQSIIMAFSSEILANWEITRGLTIMLLEHLSILLINFIGFTMVFKFVHDAVVSWKLAMSGAIFTAVLLYLGQIFINYYLGNYFYAADAGIAGTILVILVWIFYTSQIIFLGAKYTSFYAKMSGSPIVPKKRVQK